MRIVANPDLAGERVERGDVGVDQVHPGEAVTAMSGEEETTFRYRALATDHIVVTCFYWRSGQLEWELLSTR